MSEVLPRRNLGLAENWGRAVEGRLESITQRYGVEIQALGGLGRYTAAEAEMIARNGRVLEDSLNSLPYYFSRATAFPAAAISTSWSSIASIDVPMTLGGGKPFVEIVAMATCATPYPGGSSTTAFSWPFSLSLVTSEYGPRVGGFHQGIDFAGGAASGGNPIPAAGDGVVAVAATGHAGWGNYVRLEHNVDGTTMSTLYAHMMYAPSVSVGATVTRGQTLGFVGDTGNSYGNHLHFETWTSASFGSHADPRWFMSMYGETTTSTSPPRMRIVIDGTPSIEFSGHLSIGSPPDLNYVPVFGRSLRPDGPNVTVSLEAVSGSAVTARPDTTLQVMGSIHV